MTGFFCSISHLFTTSKINHLQGDIPGFFYKIMRSKDNENYSSDLMYYENMYLNRIDLFQLLSFFRAKIFEHQIPVILLHQLRNGIGKILHFEDFPTAGGIAFRHAFQQNS